METGRGAAGKFPGLGAGRAVVGAGETGSRAVVKCLSLANGRRQLPLVTRGQGPGTEPERPSPRQPHLWPCQASAGRGSETRLPPAATPTPGLSRRPRPAASFGGGRGLYSREEAGRRERGDRTPWPGRSELEPAQARRRPARRLGPHQPVRGPPRGPRVPARPPRAPRRSR